jgi:hypothetical protein
VRVAYFDIFSGISGNMILGALLDMGLDLEFLKDELAKLDLDGYQLKLEKRVKNGITGAYLEVEVRDNCDKRHGRHLADIESLIEESELNREVKDLSKRIFRRLAEAEAKIHNRDIEEIHFHEVGAVDSIVDIVGAVIGIKSLGIEEIYASRVHTGTGFVNCAHGKIPVPAPATLELLRDIPIYSSGIQNELVTPTGAAIITTLAKKFAYLPLIKLEKIGYGAGSRDLEIPNLLRISIGELL